MAPSLQSPRLDLTSGSAGVPGRIVMGGPQSIRSTGGPGDRSLRHPTKAAAAAVNTGGDGGQCVLETASNSYWALPVRLRAVVLCGGGGAPCSFFIAWVGRSATRRGGFELRTTCGFWVGGRGVGWHRWAIAHEPASYGSVWLLGLS